MNEIKCDPFFGRCYVKTGFGYLFFWVAIIISTIYAIAIICRSFHTETVIDGEREKGLYFTFREGDGFKLIECILFIIGGLIYINS